MEDIKKYRQGNMQAEELDNFTRKFINAKFNADKKNRWKKMLKEQHDVDRNTPNLKIKPKTKTRNLYMLAAAVAAAILLLIVANPIIQSFSAPSYEQLASNFIDQGFYENQEISKGEESVEQLKLNAIFAYNQKDFPTAIKYWEAVVSIGVVDETAYFFLGLSHLYNKTYDKAIANLQKVQSFENGNKFEEETRWFLSLAYLKSGDLKNAKIALTSIDEGMWNYDKALQLLNELK